MFNRREKADERIDTLIGKGANVVGDIEFSGGLHIDGHVTGSVSATAGTPGALSVSEHGVINGDIMATDRVVLGAKARVQGNVHYGVIEMALGAEINGKLFPVGGAEADAGNASGTAST
jgi:cytoskeletal protein CcmA (bactofilin family)